MQHGAISLQGTSRSRNEDRYDVAVIEEADEGQPFAYVGVFDGHGGVPTSDWLESNFSDFVDQHWDGPQRAVQSITEAFMQADKKLLAPKRGFLGGMGERGVGGSKCGATAAVALLYKDAQGRKQLLAANAGDARVVLARNGKAVQLTTDHVPDMEAERLRIERLNPNPKFPLVRYIGGTWRVGGLLALSRAFGDAYLKGTGQFEGVAAGSDGYSSGFGVIAQPDVTLTELQGGDSWVLVASDGLFENEVRGGGGGLENQAAVDMCLAAGDSKSAEELAENLAAAAVQAGSTDDVTVVVLKLNT
eukprot:jgi/Astpho2/8745/fgenesh1_pm.00128_%23_11_t